MKKAESLEQLGIYAFTEGDYEKALSHLEEAAKINARSARPYFWRGLSFQALNQPLNAAMSFNRALDYDSTNYLTHYHLAKSYRALRMFNRAIESDSVAIKLKPDFLLSRLDLGLLHLERKNYDAAISTLKEVIARKPQHALAHFYIGQCYLAKGLKDSTEFFFAQSCVLDSTNYNSFLTLGTFYYQNHRYEEGISSFRQAGSIDPWSPEVFHKLGDGYSKRQEHRKAVVSYFRAVQLGDSSVQALSGLGSAFFSLQAYDSAIVYFNRAASRDSSDPLLHYNLGVALSRKDKHREAISEFEKASRLSRTDFTANIFVQMGINYYHIHQLKKARNSYRRALEITPQYPVALYNLAVLYDAGLHDEKSARRYYKEYLAAAKEDQSQGDLVGIVQKRIEALSRKPKTR